MLTLTISKGVTVDVDQPALPGRDDICGILRYESEDSGGTHYAVIANGHITILMYGDDGTVVDTIGEFVFKGNQLNVVGPHSFQCG
jgi:hypothetical protein